MVLALGGASWPRLGSDASWVPLLRARDVTVRDFKPANCGFDVGWSTPFIDRFAGAPVKTVTLSFEGVTRRGEFIVTGSGIEGGVVYALSALLREQLDQRGPITLTIDLAPDRTLEQIRAALEKPRGARSMSTHLARAGFSGVKAGLLRECLGSTAYKDISGLADHIKALPLNLQSLRPIAESISSAGGIAWEALNQKLMLKNLPGIFCAGEMLDWEAPTGGYLLTTCFATGLAAGKGARDWLATRSSTSI